MRDGNRMVPWYEGGPAYGPYAGGYYGAYALNGLFPAVVLGSMMGGFGGWGDGSYAEGFADGQDAAAPPTIDDPAVLDVQDLRTEVRVGGAWRAAVDGVSLRIGAGEVLALVLG